MTIFQILQAASFSVLALPIHAQGYGATAPRGAAVDKVLVYVGTYTGPKSQGIYLLELDLKTGALSPVGLAAKAQSPSFLALHPNGKVLYAANESGGGAVSAFAIDAKTGKLEFLNQKGSKGEAPCHLVVDPTGKNVLLANYGGGSVAVFPLGKDGTLGEASAFIQHKGSSVNKSRQAGPHGHFIAPDPSNRFALACDLGLDQVLIYRFDPSKGTLTPNDPPAGSVPPGAGPRHLAFDPKGKFAFVINELACTVTSFTYDGKRGALSQIETVSTLPPGESVKRNYSTAEIEVHPNGKFVYGSNRGHDSIVVYAFDAKSKKLQYLQNQSSEGKTPRNFAIAPGGKFLLAANQDSDTVVVFKIDPKTGRLSSTGISAAAPSPVCVTFLQK